MLLQTSFDELNNIISEKAQIKGLSLSYHSSDTATVSYLLNILGIASPSIKAKVKILSIEGGRITAEVDAGNVGDFILDKAKKILIEKTPEGLIEQFDGKQAVLNLDAIPDLKPVFENLAINSLSFSESDIFLDAALK